MIVTKSDNMKRKDTPPIVPEQEFAKLYMQLAEGAFDGDSRFLSDELIAYLYGIYTCLAEGSKKFNLTSIVECGAVIEKHLIDSLLPLKFLIDKGYIKGGEKLADIGCGAGFPSLPFAAAACCGAFPDFKVCAVDSTAKKIRYIKETAEHLSIDLVEPVAGRAEELSAGHMRESFDIAAARAVAALPVLLELTAPFVKPGGIVASFKACAEEEIKAASNAAQVLGMDKPEIISYNLPSGDKRTLVIYKKLGKTPLTYPRAYSKILSKTL